MEIQQYVEEMRNFQDNLIEYLDKSNDFQDNYTNLVKLFNIIFNKEDNQKIKELFISINKISNNHHRSPDFFEKIQKLFLAFAENIKKTFSNLDLLKIFHHNKLVLLLLIENSILKIDNLIADIIKQPQYHKFRMIEFFYPELKPFLSEEKIKRIEENIEISDESNNFLEKRRIGENDSYICELIRNDSIIDFITYVNRTNLSVNSTIKQSIFETNPFLLQNASDFPDPSLIEYSSFYGSIQIFKYLALNDAFLSPNLWFYSIHGSNPEIIHYLEENEIIPNDNTYKECFDESIKCFNNDIAIYIQDNLMRNQSNNNNNYCFKCHNYSFFPDEYSSKAFFYLCKYNYIFFVDQILRLNNINICEEIISKKFLNEIHNSLFINEKVFILIYFIEFHVAFLYEI